MTDAERRALLDLPYVATARRAVHDAEREYRIVARVAPISGSHARYQRGSADALAAARETYRRARIEAGL